jgi:hypothetical protein
MSLCMRFIDHAALLPSPLRGRGEHEFERQPIEQFRMRRQRALDAEVVLGFDQTFAEVLLPHAVHEDAGGQRVLRRHQPFREIEPIRLPILNGERIENCEDIGLDCFAEDEEIAAHLDLRHARLLRFPQHQGRVDLGIERF